LPLKIIKTQPTVARIVLISVVVLCLAACWFFIKWNFANLIASRLDTTRPESRIVADWLTQTSPDDPQTHYGAALVFEKTLDAADLSRSLAEYEAATALSPNNYLMWLALGKARNLNGDPDGALAAFGRALELAPNYAAVQWVYGNSLVRQGRTDEGFALIAKASASDPQYAPAAVTIAMQIFDGDITKVRQGLGDTDQTNAALASMLASQERFDDAVDMWSKIGSRQQSQRRLGETLAGTLAAAHKYRLATRVMADLLDENSEKPTAGQISNGGFENGVKLRDAKLFEWQIAEGAQPQIGLSEGQAHSGKHNLWLLFNSFESSAFRSIAQTVAVEPGAEYEFEVFYRSDVKTTAALKWEIANAVSTFPIAATQPMTPAGEWTPLRVRFTAPPDTDGVIIRLARDGCGGPSCPMSGKLTLDDLSLRRL
jgi:tetratricopeptide (TPR) repeat protein